MVALSSCKIWVTILGKRWCPAIYNVQEHPALAFHNRGAKEKKDRKHSKVGFYNKEQGKQRTRCLLVRKKNKAICGKKNIEKGRGKGAEVFA